MQVVKELGAEFFKEYLMKEGTKLNMLLEAEDKVLTKKQLAKQEADRKAKIKDLQWTRNIVYKASRANNY
jgi:hypothetical protein